MSRDRVLPNILLLTTDVAHGVDQKLSYVTNGLKTLLIPEPATGSQPCL